MADIAQVLATGGTALVSAAAGAGLTYWLGALNRRHQEARENETRWYEARLQAYVEFHQAIYDLFYKFRTSETSGPIDVADNLGQRVLDAVGAIQFVGSPEVIEAAGKVLDSIPEQMVSAMSGAFIDAQELFHATARKDLGHPSP